MPKRVRCPAMTYYRAALSRDAGRFTFVSYGHAYCVDALPIHRDNGGITAVLGIATPARKFPAAAAAYERTAERLARSAVNAGQRADRHRAPTCSPSRSYTGAPSASTRYEMGAPRSSMVAHGLR
jgi:hypothetical protein